MQAQAAEVPVRTDRLGNELAPSLPYARGDLLSSTEDDYRKLEHAWRLIGERVRDGGRQAIYNFSGLERSLQLAEGDIWSADDEIAPAIHLEVMNQLALEHLGGDARDHDIAVFNRLTGATYATLKTLVQPGETVIASSAGHSHPSVMRAVRQVGAGLIDTRGYDAFEEAMHGADRVTLVVLTRLAVTYDIMPIEELRAVIDLAHKGGIPIYLDDAGGARVGPAVYDQPKLLELGVEVGATGLDKYGTLGPRLGLLGGRRDLVSRIRASGFEMGLEARPMLYPAVRHSLESYTSERVNDLVAATKSVADALATKLGDRVRWNGLIAELSAEDAYEIVVERSRESATPVVPYEVVASLAMALLRDHGILTVHFVGLPPGTSSLLFKFMPAETISAFGGATAFADAVDSSLSTVASLLSAPNAIGELLFGRQPQR
jgi:L-seryl-tRNA(Ser) seleniumtransferase